MTALRVFQLIETGNVTPADPGEVIGWGTRFPSELVAVDWRRDVFPEDEHLEEPHLSIYGNLEDVATAIGADREDLYLHVHEPTGYSRRYPQVKAPKTGLQTPQDARNRRNWG